MANSSEFDEFNNRSNNFIDWLKQNGSNISPKIELADLRHRSAGRGVVAQEDLAEDEELFTIPRSSILTADSSNLPQDIKSGLEDPWLSLIMAMAYEYQQASHSSWKPYFDVLPSTFDTLMYWSAEELDYLKGSAVASKVGRKSADKMFAEQLIPLVRQHDAEFQAAQLSDDDLLELFHRMGSTIMAYAFDLETPSTASKPAAEEEEQQEWEEESDAGESLPKGMVPLADMLNADADRNNAKLFYEDDKVVMKTIQAVQAGEELFNDYGPLPRADVLRRYGYVTDHYARYDVAEISLDLIKMTALEFLKIPENPMLARLDYLDEQGVLDDGYDISSAESGDGQFPEEFRIVVNGLCLPDGDFFNKLRKKDKLPKSELSEEALQFLSYMLARRRALYPTEEDQASEQQMQSSDRRRHMASQVIAGEKAVLEDAKKAVKERLGDGKKRKVEDESSGVQEQGKKQKKG